MNYILTCESCEEKFNEETRQPIILPDCGHTYCESCINKILSASADPSVTLVCPNDTCRREITKTDPSQYSRNHKILSLIANTSMGRAAGAGAGSADPMDAIFCPKHYDKPIEYFCKLCTGTVCVRCIFDEHNGHELI